MRSQGLEPDARCFCNVHELSYETKAIIKEQYGVMVRLEGDTIERKTVGGIMRNDNLDVLLKALELTTDCKIVRRDDEISIIEN